MFLPTGMKSVFFKEKGGFFHFVNGIQFPCVQPMTGIKAAKRLLDLASSTPLNP